MEHYICTGGCKGVSEEAGVCRAADCPRHGEPMEKCDCEDGEHHGALYNGVNGNHGENYNHDHNA